MVITATAKGADLAQEIPDRIPAQQATVCQHGRCFATPWGMIRMSDQVMEPPWVLTLPTPKGGDSRFDADSPHRRSDTGSPSV